MSTKKKGLGTTSGLGKRLQALGLTESRVEDTKTAPLEINITEIRPNPHQARKLFDQEALEALAASIRQYGIVQPIVVQKKADGYELIAGERRWRAAQLCGLKTIPAIIKEYTDDIATEISLIENIQRENLDAIEEAAAYQMLLQEFGLTQEQVAEKVGKSRSHVANMMRLLQLPTQIKEWISQGKLTMGQTRPLLQLANAQQQRDVAERIMEQGLSARQVEALVRTLLAEKKPEEEKKNEPDAYLEALQDKMKMYLGTSVAIRMNQKKKKGKIEISFTSEQEFERILAMLLEEEKTHGDVTNFTV